MDNQHATVAKPRKCKYGVNKRTGKCLKRPRSK